MKPGMEYTWAESWMKESEREVRSHHFFMITCFFKLTNLWDFFGGEDLKSKEVDDISIFYLDKLYSLIER